LTVGYFSPLPPAATGVAAYSAALIPALRAHCEVRMNAAGADVALYHLGNNELHRFIYRAAFETPGVVVLHDAVLNHFFLGTLGRAEYIDEFVYNYGEWHRGLAGELWDARSRSAADPLYFRYPMLRRICECSRAVIVHNPAAARMVREHAPGAAVREIPHLFAPPPPLPPAAALRWRERHGIAPTACLFGIFGHLRESKRLHSALGAFERVRAAGIDAALLVAGRFASPDLERALEPSLRRPGILRRPYAALGEFHLMAAATDACVNLRYPSAGETSGISIHMMGIAKPVIVTAGEEVSGFPDNACLKVEAGPGEERDLAAYMSLLASSPSTRAEIGRRAAEHIASRHRLDVVARRYAEVLCECSGRAV
jgi:glycosyltransferase involved in cell wall biosynthesis